MNNPYLEELMKFKHFQSVEDHRTLTYDYAQINNWDLERFSDEFLILKERDFLRQKYAYAIPNIEAIEVICSHSPIMEIGSGTGYWASLIDQEGGEIIATEIAGKNPYFKDRKEDGYIGSFYPVKLLDEQAISVPDIFTLFICWPPYVSEEDPYDMAFEYLNLYRGDVFIYIGESRGGCTGGDDLFELLEQKWHLERTVFIPQYPAIHDFLAVYRRK